MKLLLLQPPIEDFYDTDIRLQPIGLCYLKAAVKKFLPEVDIIIKDYHQGYGRRTIALPEEFAYLKEYYSFPDMSPFSSFYHYYHFGADFASIAKDVAREKPDIVGISSLFSPYYRESLQCANEIKKHLRVPIIVGGSHVSAAPLTMLSHPAVDFIIRGEGERSLVEFLKMCIRNGARSFFTNELHHIPNLGFKEGGNCTLNEIEDTYPLEDLPIPDLTDFKKERYVYENRPLCVVFTSRGCPYHCEFCSVHLTFGNRYRRRSTNNIFAEIVQRYDEGYRVFDFEDDNLTLDAAETKKLCELLIERFDGKDVQFLAMNGISYIDLDTELLRLMKRAGFTHLNISLVSKNESIRKGNKRPHALGKYVSIVNEAARLQFNIVSYQILGLPSETLDSMIETLVFSARLPVLLGASMFYLTPNSPIADNFPPLTEEDTFKSRLTAVAIETEHCKRDDIYTLFIATRIINFLKGLPTKKEETSFEEALKIAKGIDKRSVTGAELLEILFKEHQLCAASKSGFKIIPHFKPILFFKLWSQLSYITTQNGKRIKIRSF